MIVHRKVVMQPTCILAILFLCSIGCRAKPSLKLDAEVKKIYSDDPRLHHLVKIVNVGRTDETILTANNFCSIGGSGDKPSDPIEIIYGLGGPRAVDEQGHAPVYSPYMFDPVSIHPGEYTDIDTGDKDMVDHLNSVTGTVYIIFRYEVAEDWGKRLNIWQGRISSPLLKFEIGLTNQNSTLVLEAMANRNYTHPPIVLPSSFTHAWVMTGWQGYMGVAIALTTNQFYYWFYSDVVPSEVPDYPIVGSFVFDSTNLLLESDTHLYSTNWIVQTDNGLQCLIATSDVGDTSRLLKPHPNFNPQKPFSWIKVIKPSDGAKASK